MILILAKLGVEYGAVLPARASGVASPIEMMSLAVASNAALPVSLAVVVTAVVTFYLCLMAYGIYLLISRPWRRREEALTVLDLLELGLRDGKSLEASLLGLYAWPEARVPLRLHLLVAHLQSGLSLPDALDKVPRLLPETVRELLRNGIGRVPPPQLLNVCRGSLGNPLDSRKGTLLILLIVLGHFLLTSFSVSFLFRVVVAPKLVAILNDFQTSATVPLEFGMIEGLFGFSMWGLLAASAAMSLFAFKCVWGGYWLSKWVDDRFELLLPWQRDRLRMNFSSALAMYLDAGMSEEESLLKAASSTGNSRLESRAKLAAGRLQKGERLPEVLASLDASGEFRWRMRNAFHGVEGTETKGTRFMEVLQGWIDFMRLRADQVEIQWIQSMTVISILLLGFLTGMHCWWVFKLLGLILDAVS